MPTLPQEVADVLAEAAMVEAKRLYDAAKAGSMTVGDRIGLQSLWRVASEAAAAEWSRLHKLDPEKFTDEQLARMGVPVVGAGPDEPRPRGKRAS